MMSSNISGALNSGRQSLVYLVKGEVSYGFALGEKSFILRQVFKVVDHLASLALP